MILAEGATRKTLYWWAQALPKNLLTRKTRYRGARLIDTLHMGRDGIAALYVYSALESRFSFGGMLLNLPPKTYGFEQAAPSPLAAMKPDDLVLLTTRPGLDDDEEFDLRPLLGSGSDMESIVRQRLATVFGHCSRGHVILTDAVIHELECAAENLDGRGSRARRQAADLRYIAAEFRIKSSAWYRRRGPVNRLTLLERLKPGKNEATLVYLVFIPHILDPEGGRGPSLLTVFGMDGTMTLLWSHLLQSSRADLIRGAVDDGLPRLVVARFQPRFPRIRTVLPGNLDFVRGTDLEVKIDIDLPVSLVAGTPAAEVPTRSLSGP